MTGAAEADLPRQQGVVSVDQLDPERCWAVRPPERMLRVPIGFDGTGVPVTLDLNPSHHGGNGPHALLVGAAGAGKTELLRSLVLGLAVHHHPAQLELLLVDHLGGTFRGLERLPQVLGVVGQYPPHPARFDIDPSLFARLGRFLHWLADERLGWMGALGARSMEEYNQARKAAQQQPMRPMVIAVDHYDVLVGQSLEVRDALLRLAEQGEALGMHLLVSGERLDPGALGGLERSLSCRIVLGAGSPAESRMLLGTEDAYGLPPGAGFLTGPVGGTVLFQAPDQAGLVQPVADRVASWAPPRPRALWPPPLRPMPLAEVLGWLSIDPERGLSTDQWQPGRMTVPLGRLDHHVSGPDGELPRLELDLGRGGGHVAVCGRPGSGGTTALLTLLTTLAVTHTPREAGFYCLDFDDSGRPGLAELDGLPHTATVSGPADPGQVRRVLGELTRIARARTELCRANGVSSPTGFRQLLDASEPGPLPREVFLVVDNLPRLLREHPGAEAALLEIAARGPLVGVHLVITTDRWAALPPQLVELVPTRLELRLAEPQSSLVEARLAEQVPLDVPGRGILLDPRPDGAAGVPRHFQLAAPVLPRTATPAEVSALITQFGTGMGVPRLEPMPTMVRPEQLPPAPGSAFPIGVDEALAPVSLDPFGTAHMLIYGEPGSGRTNLLRLLLTGIAENCDPGAARIVLTDHRGGLADLPTRLGNHLAGFAPNPESLQPIVEDLCTAMSARLAAADAAAAEGTGQGWAGPEIFLIVDDYDHLSGPTHDPLLPLLPLLPAGGRIGLHVVLARSTAGAAKAHSGPILMAVRAAGATGVLLSGDPQEGPLFGPVAPSPLPPGRAVLVGPDGSSTLVQTTCHTDAVWQPPLAEEDALR
ncbi:type VII secretion protein EccCb [Allokutzneria sp. A3M-2-11 16]|uniref:type VII secretion protein EccCb n=1 Tax=Allokutzneria sp. A3M-2-11 16 TaxID=2962043 RepID=UPI0020B67A80|nr:type VII secretion protein EccCb [Allokutzneria sp. A3M-2-11 16]MCP3801615.1 type VII secretion protein EccCb [Allokutzneria sp. A3M-2-11 16]